MTIEHKDAMLIKSSESILDNTDNLICLASKLQNVYEKRPKPNNFKGCMDETKFAGEYTEEQIEKDNKYVEDTLSNIRKTNAGEGKEGLEYAESSFQLSEIMQAMIVDRINNHWFKDCKAIMTAEYDDLKVGIDSVFKHQGGGYLGMSFDFTLTNKAKTIHKKLDREWSENITKGKVQTVKYCEDPDTEQKGRLLVPKFIIGASKKDIEELAKAYLENDQETLNNHPFKYLMLMQIEEQLQMALNYYEENKEDRSLDFARTQYERLGSLVKDIKNEVHLDENIDNEDLHKYTEESIALDMIRGFRIMKDAKNKLVA